MELDFSCAGQRYRMDTRKALSLAIDLDFEGRQPQHFGASQAQSRPLRVGSFVGDTSLGGSCNVSELRMVPHCNGTHTEVVSHIRADGPKLSQVLRGELSPARLISVAPRLAEHCSESYFPGTELGDRLICARDIEQALEGVPSEQAVGLVVRTLPNTESKKWRCYGEAEMPPFFSLDAIESLVDRGVRHLVVDLPSIDKMFDGGHLRNHHVFWGGGGQTVTEMIYVEESVVDGFYCLNLQVPAFLSDAAPSRPVLYPVERL